ncbi:MAG: hypothetical protein HFG27_08170 [Provencibacterium sp.]|nr:hypothetical protein [Provencibacterium sp.]
MKLTVYTQPGPHVSPSPLPLPGPVYPGYPVPGPVWPGWPNRADQLPDHIRPRERHLQPPWPIED